MLNYGIEDGDIIIKWMENTTRKAFTFVPISFAPYFHPND